MPARLPNVPAHRPPCLSPLRGPLLLGSCLAALLALVASAPAANPKAGSPGRASQSAFRPALAGYSYLFPRDHGSHDEFRTEWWYYTGHLSTKNGRRFGYQLTFFRRGVDQASVRSNPSRWAIRHLYLAHLALSDHDQARFRYAEKISRAGIGKAGAETGHLRVWIDRWSAEALSPDQDHHHLQASAEDFSLDFILTPEKLPIIHGKGGVSRKGSSLDQASHYYSLTRMATTGTVTVAGEALAVSGASWMDHEFGSGDLGPDQVGWDWFSIQLENRTELMFYRLRRADGTTDPASSGTLVFPDGRSQHLLTSDVHIEALDHWTSGQSGARYPSRWHITVPTAGLMLDLIPRLSNQELMTRRSTQVTYWEGAVEVTGKLREASIAGLGYVELTGYAERFRQKL
ncbi:MAG: carotenoid 1,2-hydratase [Nitrospirae bacterium]|nr:carotenoid 1,2-hydratase [Nitrospirota bacterium]